MAAPGYPLIAAAGILTVIFWLLDWGLVTVAGFAATAFLVNFFRNPARTVPADPAVIVSPADGRVMLVDEVQEQDFLKGPARRVAVFMNIFDVHVNRAPVAGRLVAARHRPGRFLSALKEEVEKTNEQRATLWETPSGQRVLTVQIAGLLARRIVPAASEGDILPKGGPFGMICFGSRVDLYVPLDCTILVKVGDRVRAGESIVGRWP